MSIADFEASLGEPTPPAGLTPPLAALWWDAKGSWPAAHRLVAALEESRSAAWVHAYLHRREGDDANAGYWYRRAAQPLCDQPLDDERRTIVRALLDGA